MSKELIAGKFSSRWSHNLVKTVTYRNAWSCLDGSTGETDYLGTLHRVTFLTDPHQCVYPASLTSPQTTSPLMSDGPTGHLAESVQLAEIGPFATIHQVQLSWRRSPRPSGHIFLLCGICKALLMRGSSERAHTAHLSVFKRIELLPFKITPAWYCSNM